MIPVVTSDLLLTLVVFVALGGYGVAWLLLIHAGNRLTMSQLALQPGMHVLVVGCGSGRLTFPMAQQVGSKGSVLGIDIDAGKLQRAEQRLQQASITNVRFKRAGTGEGKLPHEQFDRALLFAVLGEMSIVRQRSLRSFRLSSQEAFFVSPKAFLIRIIKARSEFVPWHKQSALSKSVVQAIGGSSP